MPRDIIRAITRRAASAFLSKLTLDDGDQFSQACACPITEVFRPNW